MSDTIQQSNRYDLPLPEGGTPPIEPLESSGLPVLPSCIRYRRIEKIGEGGTYRTSMAAPRESEAAKGM